MIIKIRDTYYSSKDEPILLMLTDEDIKILENRDPQAKVLCLYPGSMDPEKVRNWMMMKEPEKIEQKIIVPKLRANFERG
jgi:hypothetical protein